MNIRFKYRSKQPVMRENAPTPATPQNTSTKDGEDNTMAKTKTELYDELVDIETSLENHPLTSGKIAEANILVEQMKEQGATQEEINEALIRQGAAFPRGNGQECLDAVFQLLEAESPQVQGGSRH